MDVDEAKRVAREEIDRLTPDLLQVSHSIHANPELDFEEHYAHELLTGVLEDFGIAVTRGAYELPTAFEATIGVEGMPTVALLCEYGALPGLGHAVGHNVVAAASLGAGLAVSRIVDALGGRIVILGTPAELAGGGKELMRRRGAFDDVDLAMMVHPADREALGMQTLAAQRLRVTYIGEPADAAAAPEHGHNALDAAVLGYQAVGALRQHIGANERVHGVFVDGGGRANVVPATASTEWYVRSTDSSSLDLLKDRVWLCLQGGADAAACELVGEWIDPALDEMYVNQALIDLYAKNAADIGRHPLSIDDSDPITSSSDLGNISHHVPALNPVIQIAPQGTPLHTPAFADAAKSEGGDSGVIDGAVMLAYTAIDCLASKYNRAAIRGVFQGTA
ncbi:MAG: amidohydrolase [Actinomycetota bacterium]